MKSANLLLGGTGTTIFTVMSALADAHGAINLGQGFPDEEGPADMLEAAAAALMDHRNQYPPLAGLPELRAAVAAASARFHGLQIDPVHGVVVTSGATEAIAASLMALIQPGDEVVLIEPLYDTYLPLVLQLGGVARLVRLNPPGWALPSREFTAAFSAKTKLLLLNSPMNPIGKVFSPVELQLIADTVIAHDCYAVCDEVYEHLVFSPARHIPLMTLPGMAERCLRIGSAGKTFSFTGWKVGYVSGPPALIEVVVKAHQNLTFTTPPNLQRAVAFGLAKEADYFVQLASGLQAKQHFLRAGLETLGFNTLQADGSYFLTADVAALNFAGDDRAFCRAMTLQAGVAAIPLSAFYASNPPTHYVRFAFCKRQSVLAAALDRLAAWVSASQAA